MLKPMYRGVTPIGWAEMLTVAAVAPNDDAGIATAQAAVAAQDKSFADRYLRKRIDRSSLA
jgi:hypothetical protein